MKLREAHNGSLLKVVDYIKLLKGERWQYIKEVYQEFVDSTKDIQNEKQKFIQMVARLFDLPTNSHGGKRHGVLCLFYVSKPVSIIFFSVSRENHARAGLPQEEIIKNNVEASDEGVFSIIF
jgi:hypothetical protein